MLQPRERLQQRRDVALPDPGHLALLGRDLADEQRPESAEPVGVAGQQTDRERLVVGIAPVADDQRGRPVRPGGGQHLLEDLGEPALPVPLVDPPGDRGRILRHALVPSPDGEAGERVQEAVT
ncbi:hypothetical protein Aph02nite_32030 [Actinoplanes philippinensis]|uniref:hypothetical protein n=1 Tax=Actinoplanes philippinensis TaxID=35752 RepID=UPI001A54E939|nr:hypothetical protein [Actinoplanes philippinensis]GIE77253.1 hypothetical protein Aph02nite_32030 [Actinoplanes philippinensis]